MRRRVAASAAVTALVAGALSGCMFITPQETIRSYTPSDGVNGTVGDVQIRNVLLVSSEGDIANMLGVLTNSSDTAATVTLQYTTTTGTETTELTVPANGLLSLRPNVADQGTTQVTTEASAVQLEDVDTVPGRLFQIGFSTGSAAPVSLSVPVLSGSLPEYQTLTPTPTPTPSATTESPSPSDSASPSATTTG